MAAPSTPPRYDFYSPVHKGLRRTMARLMERLGSGNFADAAQRAAILGELRVLIGACDHHIKHENDFLHPSIDAKEKGASNKFAGEHEGHRKEIARSAAWWTPWRRRRRRRPACTSCIWPSAASSPTT